MEVNEENQTLTKQFQREKQRRKELEDVSVGGNVCNTLGLIRVTLGGHGVVLVVMKLEQQQKHTVIIRILHVRKLKK